MRNLISQAAAALALSSTTSNSRIFGADNIERYLQKHGRSVRTGHSIAKFNRHTGQPHEHKREIARNLRRAAKA